MAEPRFKALRTPFTPLYERHYRTFARDLAWIRNAPNLAHTEKLLLKGLVSNTTNKALLDNIIQLNTIQLKKLAALASHSLRHLRNWGGRPPAGNTPTSEPRSDLNTAQEVQDYSTMDLHAGPSTAAASLLLSKRIDEIRQEGHPKDKLERLLSLPNDQELSEIFRVLCIDRTLPNVPKRKPSRGESPREDCRIRDWGSSLISWSRRGRQVAHIFPFSCLGIKGDMNELLWNFLHLLLGKEQEDILATEIQTADGKFDTLKNTLTLDQATHAEFDKGWFSLIPIQISTGEKDGYFLDVRYTSFYPSESITRDIFTSAPEAASSQYNLDSEGFPIDFVQKQPRNINDGDVYRLATIDPKGLPLPSWKLLFFHKYLWDLLSDCGVGESTRDSRSRSGSVTPQTGSSKGGSPLSVSPQSKKAARGLTGMDGACDEDYEEIMDEEMANRDVKARIWVHKWLASQQN
ncbi:hypothetical protein AA313_de0206212 [Arthrobotrys entomopaga]|nr:hypothetical protein AA313_de0206212 [Arthrobotrys entomopaga]